MIGGGYALGAVATMSIGYSGESAALLLGACFVAGFLSIGAQMCTIALCANFYETEVRATGVGWTVGIGRVGAVLGPILGGLLIAAAVSAQTFFVVAGLASLGAAVCVFALGWFALPGREPIVESPLLIRQPGSV